MKGTVRQFLAGAFMLIGLFLVLSRSGGFARSVSATGDATSGVFKTLQGR